TGGFKPRPDISAILSYALCTAIHWRLRHLSKVRHHAIAAPPPQGRMQYAPTLEFLLRIYFELFAFFAAKLRNLFIPYSSSFLK
ncbi:MAG: hypothetical protein ACXW5W_10200, partial [Candidatus Binatia bacterium]